MSLKQVDRVMSSQGSTDTTALLAAWRRGDDAALEQALPHVYSELRRLAHRHLAGEDSGHTFESRDLVHETFLRLDGQRGFQWQNRAHFFAVAGRMMRRILIDHARRKRVRGGRQNHVELDEVDVVADLRGMDLLALDEALEQLAEADAELARIVELRFFGGLRHAEVARVLDVSVPTVQRRFRLAKAWLYRKLRAGNRDLGDPDLGERDD